MSRRPQQPPITRLDTARSRMAPGGRMWSESPIRYPRRRTAVTGVPPAVPCPEFTANRIMVAGGTNNDGAWSGAIDPGAHVGAGDWVVLFLVGYLCGTAMAAPPGFTLLGSGSWPAGGEGWGGNWAVFATRAAAGWSSAAVAEISGQVGGKPVSRFRTQGAQAWAFRGLGGGAWKWATTQQGTGRTVIIGPAPDACVRLQAVIGAGYLSDGWETPYPAGLWYTAAGCFTPMGAGVATSGDSRSEFGWNAGTWCDVDTAIAHFRDQAQHAGPALTTPTAFSFQQWASGHLTFNPNGTP